MQNFARCSLLDKKKGNLLPQKLVEDLEDASNELMITDETEVRQRDDDKSVKSRNCGSDYLCRRVADPLRYRGVLCVDGQRGDRG